MYFLYQKNLKHNKEKQGRLFRVVLKELWKTLMKGAMSCTSQLALGFGEFHPFCTAGEAFVTRGTSKAQSHSSAPTGPWRVSRGSRSPKPGQKPRGQALPNSHTLPNSRWGLVCFLCCGHEPTHEPGLHGSTLSNQESFTLQP